MPMPSEFATKTQPETPEPFSSLQPEPPKSFSPRPEPPQSFKRAVKSFLLLVLTPFKPAARLVRRFLLAPIADQITNLNARTDLLFNEVQAVQGQLQAVQDRTQNLIQAAQDRTQNLIQDRTQYLISLLQDLSTYNRSRGQEFSTQITNSIALMQLLNERIQDVALRVPDVALRVQDVALRVQDVAFRTRSAILVDDSTFALRTLDGFVLVPRQDTLLLLMLLDAGPEGLEPGTRRILSKLLVAGATFVDVGAHIGLLTLAGARAVGASGKSLGN